MSLGQREKLSFLLVMFTTLFPDQFLSMPFIDQVNPPILNITSRVQWLTFEDVAPKLLQVAGLQNKWNFYVARTTFMGGIIPGRMTFQVSKPAIVFSFDGKEYFKEEDYELLSYPHGALYWEKVEPPQSDDEALHLPENVFQCGNHPRNDEPLYVCRSWLSKNSLVIGKLDKGGVCEMPTGVNVTRSDKFEVLVQNATWDKSVFPNNNMGKDHLTTENWLVRVLSSFSTYTILAVLSILVVLISGISYYIGGRLARNNRIEIEREKQKLRNMDSENFVMLKV